MDEIRKAEEKDILGIQKLLYQVGQIHHEGRPDLYKGNQTKYTAEELKEILLDPDKIVLVCVRDGMVVGHVFAQFLRTIETNIKVGKTTLFVDDVCVDENHRRQHIGEKLFEKIVEIGKNAKVHNISLHVWSFNKGAKAFYESIGLKEQYCSMEMRLD